MRQVFGIICVGLMGALAVGCAEEHRQRMAREPGYFVPTAGMVQVVDAPAKNRAADVLPESDSWVWLQRGERVAVGNTPIYEITSSNVMTYDVQRIGSWRGGFGYRYRWGWQQSVTLP